MPKAIVEERKIRQQEEKIDESMSCLRLALKINGGSERLHILNLLLHSAVSTSLTSLEWQPFRLQ